MDSFGKVRISYSSRLSSRIRLPAEELGYGFLVTLGVWQGYLCLGGEMWGKKGNSNLLL